MLDDVWALTQKVAIKILTTDWNIVNLVYRVIGLMLILYCKMFEKLQRYKFARKVVKNISYSYLNLVVNDYLTFSWEYLIFSKQISCIYRK